MSSGKSESCRRCDEKKNWELSVGEDEKKEEQREKWRERQREKRKEKETNGIGEKNIENRHRGRKKSD